MNEGDRQPDDGSEVYSLDLDEADEVERETAIRQAVEAVERHAVGSRSEETTSPYVESAAEAKEGEAPLESDEVRRLQEEAKELRERSLRTLADFENYRKRAERDAEEQQRQAVAEPLRQFLDVIDNLERAVEASGSPEDLRTGVELILRQMRDLLRRFEVEEIAALDEPFDPSLHEAMLRHEDPGVALPTVVQEFQRGYRVHGRLLRPSQVAVAVPPETEERLQEPAEPVDDTGDSREAEDGSEDRPPEHG